MPATCARLPRLLFMRPLTVLMKQTRQAVRTIKQSVYLDVYELYTGSIPSRVLVEQKVDIRTKSNAPFGEKIFRIWWKLWADGDESFKINILGFMWELERHHRHIHHDDIQTNDTQLRCIIGGPSYIYIYVCVCLCVCVCVCVCVRVCVYESMDEENSPFSSKTTAKIA